MAVNFDEMDVPYADCYADPKHGNLVTYADHVAAIAAAEQRSYELGRGDGIVLGQEQAHRDSVIIHEGAAENRGFHKGYEQGQRDAIAKAAPLEAVVLRIAATLVRHPSEDERHEALQRHWSSELKSALFTYRAAIKGVSDAG
jgi:hypothetical protein